MPSNFTGEQMTLKNSDMVSKGSGEETRREEDFGFKSVIENVLGAFSLQRGILPTMRDLLLRPNQVVDAYFRGEKRYLSPGRWLSFCIVVMGLSTWLVGPVEMTEALDDEGVGKLMVECDAALEKIVNGPPILGFVALYLPFLFSFKWMFRKSGRNWAQHWIIQIYCFGFLNVVMSLVDIVEIIGSMVLREQSAVSLWTDLVMTLELLFWFGYYFCVSRSIFGGKTFRIMIRTLVATSLSLLLMASAIIFYAIIMM